MRSDTKPTALLTFTGLFAAMITIMTAWLFHIPYGANGGYIHFGDALIYLAAVLLPRPYAIGAAVVGAGLSDLLTAPVWVIPTAVIKTLMVLMFSSRTERVVCPRNLIGVGLACLINIAGYFLATGVLYQDWLFPVVRLYTDVLPPVVCGALFCLLGRIIDRTGLKARFFV